MKKNILNLLNTIRKAFEHVAYISYFITSALFALTFAILMVSAFILSQDNLIAITDKVFLLLDKAKWYLFIFMAGIGVYGVALRIKEDKEEKK